MTSTVRRAGAFALVGMLSLSAPVLGRAAAIPFVAVAVLALFVVDEGPLFELFARPGDHQDKRLYGLAAFSLAAAGLAILASIFQLPVSVFISSVQILAFGNLAQELVRQGSDEPFLATVGFSTGGFLAGVASMLALSIVNIAPTSLPLAAFLAASGALLGALLRAVLFERDDPLVMLTIGFLLWLFVDLGIEVSSQQVLLALVITVILGYVSYALQTASIPGMLTGVLLSLLTIVLGGYGWFAMLIAFFGLGGLSTKFRYAEKQQRGIAEDNDGARGSGNVLANAAVAIAAVVGYTASPALTTLDPELFLYAFAGSLAAAMSDTLSSEIGGLYDTPRLITTLEPVPAGTDGGVTWQGEVAGVGGAALIAVIALLLFETVGTLGAGIVVFAGVAGMTVDSLLGATLEGTRLTNQGVNFLATLAAALVGVGLALATGLVGL
ncbi:DUF92 domain-containing protein [Haladaptatus sp. DYSN1]|uniref:DUF92 domain-containing protein n=1 Tax=unclassified Haladaptatus TaxID=2622732 RepID=UPI0024075892|nr:DUF92 domain-containing protein [Haladaptatus sp. DYSN1]